MLANFNNVYNLTDCIFKRHSLTFILKQGIETLQDMRKLLGIRNSPFLRERQHLFGKKFTERETRARKFLLLEKEFLTSGAFLAWILTWRRILTQVSFSTNIWRQTNMEFWWLMLIPIWGSKKIPISDMSADILYIIFECGYQIRVTKICNEGRISNKLYSEKSVHWTVNTSLNTN